MARELHPAHLPPAMSGVPAMEYSQQKPLMKVMGRMLSARIRSAKGISQSQNIKIKHRKKKDEVKYY